MASRILVPWALPEAGREILRKSKLRVTYLHGPGGELPTLEELVQAVKEADVVLPRGTQPVPREVLVGKSSPERRCQPWGGIRQRRCGVRNRARNPGDEHP